MRSSNGTRIGSYALIAGAIVLLIAIVFGNRMGSRTIFDANRTTMPQAAVTVAPLPDPTSASLVERLWKKEQIVRVAGDPGFPDPHVTPPPTPSPRPTAPPTAHPAMTQNPASNVPIWKETFAPNETGPTPAGETPPPGAQSEPSIEAPPVRSSGRARAAPTPTPTDPRFVEPQHAQ